MGDILRCVGGPYDGRCLNVGASVKLVIPDAKDQIDCLTGDGHICTLFGRHEYAPYTAIVGRKSVRFLKYLGYRKPGEDG